jgi:hypothetical protein
VPRIRSVHPDLHRDKTLAQVSASAERTFVRLWCHLDDDGRGEDDPELLKADLYPRHSDMGHAEIETDLQELARLGLIVRYKVDGERLLCCKPETWSKYQRPQKKKDSDLPGPDAPNAIIDPVRDQDDTGHVEVSPVGEGRGEGVVGEGSTPVGDGKPSFATRLANELREQGWEPPDGASTYEAFQALLTESLERKPESDHRNVTMGLISDFASKCGVELTREARSHTARLVANYPPSKVLAAWGQTVQWGAGIDAEYANDPLACSKYVAAVLSGKAA